MITKLTLLACLCCMVKPIFAQPPVITSFTPSRGPVGTTVTITGSNFDSILPHMNTVYFGAVKAAVISAPNTHTLNVAVPPGATYEPLTVTTWGLTAYSVKPFIVTFPGGGRMLPGLYSAKQEIGPVNYNYDRSVMADIDGDGRSDIITSKGTLSILRNTSTSGVISFATGVNYGARPGLTGIATGDLDGDGKLDIAVATYAPGNSGVSVFRNTSTTGVISLAPGIDYSSGNSINSYAEDVAIGDLDGDGKPDMAIRNGNRTMSVYRNISSAPGTIAFGFRQEFSIGVESSGNISFSDLNGDGMQDVIVSNGGSNSITLFQNTSRTGNISFESGVLGTAQTPIYACEGDLDNDGKNELVVAATNSYVVSVYKNNSTISTISFAGAINYPVDLMPGAVALSDVDGDGLTDMVVSEIWYDKVYVFRHSNNSTTISFDAPLVYQANAHPFAINAGDIDLDGTPDLVTSGLGTGNMAVFRNTINDPIVTPSGANPVNGTIVSRVIIDPSVQTHNGFPYVQRHYDIEPAVNAGTSTATVTLFFTQQEFDNYNAFPGHATNLPSYPADDVNKANLRIFQYHGSSTSSLPGTYSGNGVSINPDDDKIVWNTAAQWWEVTFDVTGFSGFFAGSDGNNILPLSLLSITAYRQGNQAIIEWITSREKNVSHFIVQRSTDGRVFSSIAQLPATNQPNNTTYRYADEMGAAPVYYYRLQIIDENNTVVTSKQVSVKSANAFTAVTVYPNPAKNFVRVNHPAASTGTSILLIDMAGRVVKRVTPAIQSTQTLVYLQGNAKGNYQVLYRNKNEMYSCLLTVE